MDPPRSTSRSSRRSYPNLHNLSLAPLSSKYSVDASSPPSPPENQPTTPHTYIQHKSAPSTPGILSLSQSRSNSRNGRRRSRGQVYAYDGYFLNPDAPVRDMGDIPKAKSTSSMLPGVSFADQPHARHHKRKSTEPGLKLPAARHHTTEGNDEWFYRAGLAIAGEARDAKGQSWLVRRESSTSLVQQGDEFEVHSPQDARSTKMLSGENLADAEFATFTPRMSRVGSRVGSRVASARGSRRGSRVGSRADLYMSGVRTPSARHSLEMEETFSASSLGEPDFIDNDGESDGDEGEVARLASQRRLGLGGWMDRLIDWTLFSVEEDREESSEDEEEEEEAFKPENMTKEELKLRREVEAKRRKLEREAIIAASAAKMKDTKEASKDGTESKPVPDEEGGGWQDAAWLLSIASKVLL